MTRTPPVATSNQTGLWLLYPIAFAIFSPRRAKPGRRKPRMPKGNEETRKWRCRFDFSSTCCQASDLQGDVVASRLFQMAEEMKNPRLGQKLRQDLPPSDPVL